MSARHTGQILTRARSTQPYLDNTLQSTPSVLAMNQSRCRKIGRLIKPSELRSLRLYRYVTSKSSYSWPSCSNGISERKACTADKYQTPIPKHLSAIRCLCVPVQDWFPNTISTVRRPSPSLCPRTPFPKSVEECPHTQKG